MAYWGDDVPGVTDYVATLVASVNVIYERDLDLRLLVGTTFLHVSTTPDPWTQSSTGNADARPDSDGHADAHVHAARVVAKNNAPSAVNVVVDVNGYYR